MSEVKRFNIIGYKSDDGCFVNFSDFDATQSELAALREELDKVCGDEWRKDKRLLAETRQRLTAAEQRNAVMTKALERIARPHDCGCLPCTGDCMSKLSLEITVDEMRELAEAALTKPTESGASE